MNVMLLAAGEGTRLRPYTLVRPKPAMPFLNIPLASYPLAFLEDLKVDRLVVNTFHLPTKIVDLFIKMNHGARKLHFSHEVTQILGSGGGLGAARDYFKTTEDLIMMNADEVLLPLEPGVLAKALEHHQKNRSFCTLITMDHAGVGTQFGGVWLDKDGKVIGFGKNRPTESCVKAEHFVGIQILSGKIFEYLPEGTPSNILYDAVAKAISEGLPVTTYKIECQWFETGNPDDFLKATQACLKILADQNENYTQNYLRQTLARFSVEVPEIQMHERALVLKTASAEVADDVTLSGFAVMGSHVKIASGASLHNTVIADHVRIAADTYAQNKIFLESTEAAEDPTSE